MERIRVNTSAFIINNKSQAILEELWSEMIENGFDMNYYSEDNGDVI